MSQRATVILARFKGSKENSKVLASYPPKSISRLSPLNEGKPAMGFSCIKKHLASTKNHKSKNQNPKWCMIIKNNNQD